MQTVHIIHDLRNLLMVAAGHVDTMQAPQTGGDAVRAQLDELSRCLDSMFELVAELLPGPGAEVGPAYPVDLNTLVAERAPMLRVGLRPDVELTILPAPEPAVVRARPVDVERILLNLVLNAAEAMRLGGTICVQVSRRDGGEGRSGEPPGGVRLTVRDSGPGLPAALQDVEIHARRTGRFGLASVRLLALRLGGRFYVESEPGQGTSVSIDLPHTDPNGLERDGAAARPSD